jgi:hypothetical protein
MSTTQPVGLPGATAVTDSRRRGIAVTVVRQSDAAGEFTIRAAPARDPCLNPEEAEATRKVRPNLFDVTAFNRP